MNDSSKANNNDSENTRPISERALWDADPLTAFTEFIRSNAFIHTSNKLRGRPVCKALSVKSAAIYINMFGKFARWLQLHDKKLSSLTSADLRTFLDLGSTVNEKWVPDLNSNIKQRYLRMIERCYLHLKVIPNPAQHALFDSIRTGKMGHDLPAVVLDNEQFIRFCQALPAVATEKTPWKRQRDRVMQLVLLCSGLRMAEVLGLKMDEIDSQIGLDGSLQIVVEPDGKHDTSYAHTTVLNPIAVPELLEWLRVRSALPLSGRLLFPNGSGQLLHKTSVYRQVTKTFAQAKIDIPRSGGRTLRNTFAVVQLQAGVSIGELREQLGLALPRSAAAYLALVPEK